MENKRILSAIYEQFENELPPTQKYKDLQSNLISETNNFLQTIGEQNRQKLEELFDIIYAMGKEEGKQYFYEGISIPFRLITEIIDKD